VTAGSNEHSNPQAWLMPPSEDSVSLHAPTISSIYSAWSSVGLTIGAVSLDAATKPLIGLMLHQKASKNIAVTRGIPLTQESARSLVEYLLYVLHHSVFTPEQRASQIPGYLQENEINGDAGIL
jgi:hypothetical protein